MVSKLYYLTILTVSSYFGFVGCVSNKYQPKFSIGHCLEMIDKKAAPEYYFVKEFEVIDVGQFMYVLEVHGTHLDGQARMIPIPIADDEMKRRSCVL